jgi:myosin heavy subunit
LPFIGVLDIFGFEVFEVNSFEQLLINFANEKLQLTFNNAVLAAEQKLYKEEGLMVSEVHYANNEKCVQLLSEKNIGILPLLTSTGKTPKATDLSFNTELHNVHGGKNKKYENPYFPRPHPRDLIDNFIVRHFARPVQYTVGSFIAKNSDAVPEGLEACLASSPLFELFKEGTASAASEAASPSTSRAKTRAKPSVCGTFNTQMTALGNLLESTTCSFVRCIKPNAAMKAGLFDPKYVLEQLRSLGIVQTCEVLKSGLPTRIRFSDIDTQYRPHLPPQVQTMFKNVSSVDFTHAIFWAMQIDPNAFQRGKTRVFFKTGKVSVLHDLLNLDMGSEKGIMFKQRLSRFLSWKSWRRAYVKVIAQQRFLKSLIKLRLVKKAGRTIWACWRRFKRTQSFKRRRICTRRWRIAIWRTIAINKFLFDFRLIRAANEEREAKEKEAAELMAAMEALAEEERLLEENRKLVEAEDEEEEQGGDTLGTMAVGEGIKRRTRTPSTVSVTVRGRNSSRALSARALSIYNDPNSTEAAIQLMATTSSLATATATLTRWRNIRLVRGFERWKEAVESLTVDSYLQQVYVQQTAQLKTAVRAAGITESELCFECGESQNRVADEWCVTCNEAYCQVCSAFVHSACKHMTTHDYGIERENKINT